MADVTVFVGTYNRLDTLARCVDLLEQQDCSPKVVIVDNGSRDRGAQLLLEQLAELHTVYRLPPIEDVPPEEGDEAAHGGHGMQAVKRNYEEAFRRELDSGNQSEWFAVNDCDVHLDGHANSIRAYIWLAEQTGRACGPHLRLNVGRDYLLRSFALILNARVLFRDRMQWTDDIPWTPDDIDSTFHLFPASSEFRRLKMDTARVGPPWMATHSDWCVSSTQPTEESFSYVLQAGEAASWGARWISSEYAAFLRSPEEAFQLVEKTPKRHDDYYLAGYMLSWMLQYGHGCEVDLERSRYMLRVATPEGSPCWDYERHWDALVYDDDQTFLGWQSL